MPHRDAGQLLRDHGFRSTRGRVELLNALRRARRPLTHADILKRLPGKPFDRVSIYRALEALEEAGVIHRAYHDGRTWAYETAEHCEHDRCHPHFTCQQCGAVSCLTETVVPLVRGLPEGYVLARQQVHIDGTCPACARKAAAGKTLRKGARP